MEAGAPEGFFCPISLKLFRDPVMLPTGQTCASLPPLGQPELPMPDTSDPNDSFSSERPYRRR